MKVLILSTVCFSILSLNTELAHSQTSTVEDNVNSVSSGLSAFALELLTKTAIEGGDQINVIISPYNIWNLLAILTNGAAGSTANQLLSALRIPRDANIFRVGYKAILSTLNANTPGVDITTANAIFTDRNKQLSKDFQTQTSNQYNVNFLPVNFQDPINTVNYIDNFIAKATNNRIQHFINYDDLINAQLLLTTAIYFKGSWTTPFNKTATSKAPFYDENFRQTGVVDMMFQSAPFPYALQETLQAVSVELPYGPDEKFSMILLQPQQGIKLSTMLNRLSSVPFRNITETLEIAKENYPGEDTLVYMPRFKISSDFVLNIVLEKMGIVDVFDPSYANLLKISNDNVYLTRVIHKAEIEVNEEGTVASGATGGLINYKQPPPVFTANRPFAFFIIEKSTNTMLFAGKISNPNQI